MTIDELWTAACSNNQETIRAHYENGGERNLRYNAFGIEHSLIVGAYRNHNMDMARLLFSYGETVTDAEKQEFMPDVERMEMVKMLGLVE